MQFYVTDYLFLFLLQTAKALKELAKEKPDIYKFVMVTSFYPDVIYQVSLLPIVSLL